jgi:hypothetical protein
LTLQTFDVESRPATTMGSSCRRPLSRRIFRRGVLALPQPVGAHRHAPGLECRHERDLGLPVSGVPLPSLLKAHVHGPEAITGGEFGPEDGAVMAVLVVVSNVISVAWLVRSDAFRTPAALQRPRAGSWSGTPDSNR